MKQVTSLEELIKQSEISRNQLNHLIDNAKPELMTEKGVCGEWSIKDILAHIVAWEYRMQTWLQQIIETGEIPAFFNEVFKTEKVDAFNHETYLAYKDKLLPEVILLFLQNQAGLIKFLKSLPEDQLFDTEKMPFGDGHPLWYLVAANTFWHYDDHIAQIEVFLRKQNEQ